jgi:hypothetical protein
MKPNLLILNRVSGPPADGWYQIEVSGEHPASGNRIQVIDAKAMESMVARFTAEKAAAGENWAGMLVDGDHLSHDEANSTEAFAWCQELAIRNGELFGRLDLTDLGEPAIRNKRFKFFSTEYDAEDLEDLGGGRVRPLRLAGLAFTNRPNNKGGKPISNRGSKDAGGTPALLSNRADDPSGEPTKTTQPTQTMKSIAEKLGLSAEATEADILNAITALLSKVAEAETKAAEGAAEEVMNRFGTRIPEAARPHWKAELIRNRATTETLMENSFPEGTATPGQPAIFNRADAIGQIDASVEFDIIHFPVPLLCW